MTATKTGRDTRGITPWKQFSADASKYFSADEIAKAKAYVRPLHFANGLDKTLTLIAEAAAIGFHLAPKLIDKLGIESWPLGILVSIFLIFVVDNLVSAPIQAWRELSYEKRSGMSSQTVGGFMGDLFKGLLVGSVLFTLILIPLWALIRSTDTWWLWGWGVMVAISLSLAVLFPVVIAPIFNKFKDLEDGEMNTALLDLARKAGADIDKVQVSDASRRTRRDNAYVAGLGKTRQVVVFDNLLEREPRIVESVVGHEIGHWKLGHLKRTIPLNLVVLFLNFAVLGIILKSQWVLDFAGVDSLGDPGAAPLFMVLFPTITPLLGLLNTWLTRAHERDADLYALELTQSPETFVETMRALHTDNKADLDPPRWRAISMSHPPVAERMAMGEAWAAAQA